MNNNKVKKMVVNLANTFFIHKVVMHILGFWISPAYSIIYKIYSFFLYIFFTIPIPTLPIIFVAVDDNVNMLDAAQSLFMAIQIFGLIFKIYSIKSNFAGVEKTFSILNSEVFNQQYAGQDHILQESSRIAKRNTIVFLLFCYASLFGWGLLPIFTGSGQLPIDVWLPFKVPDTKVNHVILYIWLFMGKLRFTLQYIFIICLFRGWIWCSFTLRFRHFVFWIDCSSKWAGTSVERHVIESSKIYRLRIKESFEL